LLKSEAMATILVIEDEESIRVNLLEILMEENFTAVGAKNGSEGITLAQNSLPNLILCDVTMPEVDGYGVLQTLQQNPKTAKIPFIFLTALGDKKEIRKGMNLGADDYLTKPYSIDELLEAINSRLERNTSISQYYIDVIDETADKLNLLNVCDRLTKLPERSYLQEQFTTIVQSQEDNQKKPYLSVLCIGLSRLDIALENLGYSWHDFLIKAVAARLKKCLGNDNIISRLSNEEFAVLITTARDKHKLSQIAKKLLEVLSQPYIIEQGKEVYLLPSIGIANYSIHSENIEKLLLYSSQTMKHVRKQGGNLYEFYRVGFNSLDRDRLALETDLNHALERQELEVYYQPRIDIETNQIIGAEALIRWNHPVFGLLAPNKFIDIAEETNLIVPIGEWVLRTACKQAKKWQEAGFTSFRIAVNLSLRQLNQINFQALLFEISRDTDFKSKYIDLELTETTILQQPEIMAFRLRALKTTGVKIAIDDFGKGYSSLIVLKQLPFDILKIDRAFIRNIHQEPKNQAIVTAIVQMANNLNLSLIAEGVETTEELAFLREQKCREVQGYLFSHPLNTKDFEKLLFSGKKLQLDEIDSELSTEGVGVGR
jgi:diguanylate cyclase